jgi:hypothetical protein
MMTGAMMLRRLVPMMMGGAMARPTMMLNMMQMRVSAGLD